MELGGRLRGARLMKGLTQEEAARIVGTSAQSIRNWEIGRHEPQQDSIEKLASCYDVAPESLLHDQGSDPVELWNNAVRYNRIIIDPERLRQARTDANMTRMDVENITGIGRYAMGRYERGETNPRPGALAILARVYDKPIEWFGRGGYLTREEKAVLGVSTDADGDAPPPEGEAMNLVMNALEGIRRTLTLEQARSIADYIRFIEQSEITKRQNLERNREWRSAMAAQLEQ